MVRFVERSLSFYQLNISCADIPCVLEDGVVEAARPTQPVSLHITVNITPYLAEEPTIHGRVRFPVPEPFLPLSDHQPVETGPTGHIQFPAPEPLIPPSHHQPVETGPDEAVRRIVPTYRSDMWQEAVERIKLVMDALDPIAEVRVMPF